MHELAFYIRTEVDSEEVWERLQELGCQLLYSSEESEGASVIFGRIPAGISQDDILKRCPALTNIIPAPFDPIDWEKEWSTHCKNYVDGILHVPLSEYTSDPHSPTLQLKPGPGFGDLTHPTTLLVLALMPAYVKDKHVIDIGCGSGILSIAALAMGASSVLATDIDKPALVHARENAELNGIARAIHLCLPDECLMAHQNKTYVALMNMIQSEQCQAWDSLKNLHPHINSLITSGILTESKQDYLKQCKAWGWKLDSEIEESEWSGFHFSK